MDLTISRDSQAEHWELTALLADARLSLLLTVQNAGATPIQTGVRLRVMLSSLPEIIVQSPGSNRDDHRTSPKEQDDRTVLVVESDPDTSTIHTEHMGNEICCTITDYQGQEHLPIVEPGGLRRLSVLIGLSQAQSDHV
jgi:hypothetical protein